MKKDPGDTFNEKDQNILNMVMMETERLSALIQELLFCSQDCGVAPTEFELDRAVEAAIHKMAYSSPMELKVRYSGVSSLYIRGHVLQIEKVLINLLTNAAEATLEGGDVRVVVTTGEREGFHRITVKDTGVGVPDYLKDKLFESFASAKINHLGTGLTVADQIIKSHGGKLDFNPRVRKGAEFTIDLPAVGFIQNMGLEESTMANESVSPQNP
tara:strand:- start:517 stop:1158 length:642 start_codon:yes stop_codon:yes gene_type:complete